MIELPIVDAAATQAQTPRERFWRSLSQLRRDPAYQQLVQEEFMPGASEPPSGASRRQFLQLMGASMALGGLTACRRPVERIMPYVNKPEEIIPGIPLYYATAMPLRGVVHGLLVESHVGRPTKVEGNPEHPVSQGAAGVFQQASILTLYDPDRSKRVLQEGRAVDWNAFVDFSQQLVQQAASRRVVVLSEPSASPTVQAIRERMRQRYPGLRWITYQDDGDDPVRLGLGGSLRPLYRFSEADVIVSLDADFLGPTDTNYVQHTCEFAQSRRLAGPEDQMSRLYVVESAYSLTGGKADHRLPLRSIDIPALTQALAAQLGAGGVGSSAFANHPFVTAMARDLQQAGGRGVVLAGDTQPAAVHALCAAINGAIGSQVVTLVDTGDEPEPPLAETLPALVEEMRGGLVDTLIVVGANPVYSAPGELGFAEALQRVDQTIHVGLYQDETAQACRWHVPRTHYLEAWGDGRAYDGTLSVIQPLIAPLYDDAHSEVEVLNLLATGLDLAGYDLVREQWRGQLSGNFENAWRKVLHDGFLPNSGYPTAGAAGGGAAGAMPPLPALAADDLELVFRLDPSVLDGSYANSAWMQELPDPVTKIVWDAVATIGPDLALRLGIDVEYDAGRFFTDVIAITVGDQRVELPAWVVPGHPDGSVGVPFGYGGNLVSDRVPRIERFFDTDYDTDVYAMGPLANEVGANVAPLRSRFMERVVAGVGVEKTGERYMIATTQEHGSLEGRPIVRMATLDHYREAPNFANEVIEPLPGGEPWVEYPALWQEDHPSDDPAFKDNLYFRNQWGMVVDLNTCTGCNACIIACQSENNIPVIGKEEVSRGREMHWMRLDRYFVSPALREEATDDSGLQEEELADLQNPRMVVQPMLCQHCENAPCESVCPVAATVHSPDGTNQMIYNRCIGTRYCSNNCPYKVRRFNFFNWTKTMPLQVQMQQNPNVTVRFRGVMEKCSYCIQRIREVGRRANLENRAIADGEVQTACQQTCPAQAISFGDLNDPSSQVRQIKQQPRNYQVLEELNVKPRTTYLGLVVNPNPGLATTPV